MLYCYSVMLSYEANKFVAVTLRVYTQVLTFYIPNVELLSGRPVFDRDHKLCLERVSLALLLFAFKCDVSEKTPTNSDESQIQSK